MADLEPAIQAALAVREHAYVPYSHYPVGAALQTAGGTIWTGCNVESSSYGLTMCAERNAVFKAVSEGGSDFVRVVVAVDTDLLAPPCGACRQVMWDICRDIEVVLVNLHGKSETFRLSELLPRPFDGSSL